jgi:hypothetical protein
MSHISRFSNVKFHILVIQSSIISKFWTPLQPSSRSSSINSTKIEGGWQPILESCGKFLLAKINFSRLFNCKWHPLENYITWGRNHKQIYILPKWCFLFLIILSMLWKSNQNIYKHLQWHNTSFPPSFFMIQKARCNVQNAMQWKKTQCSNKSCTQQTKMLK